MYDTRIMTFVVIVNYTGESLWRMVGLFVMAKLPEFIMQREVTLLAMPQSVPMVECQHDTND